MGWNIVGKLIICFLSGIVFFVFQSNVYASNLSVSGKAKVSNTGNYLDFTNYLSNVTVDDSSGDFNGYAFMTDVGWVAFGTQDNSSGPVNINLTTGAVSGKAKVLNTGNYLDFTSYSSNVTATIPGGVFSGYVFSQDMGWLDFSDTGVSIFGLPGITPTSSTSSSSSNSTPSAPVCNDAPPGTKAPWLYSAITQDLTSVLLYFTEADDPVDKYVLAYGTKSGDYPYGSTNIGGKGTRTYLVQSLSPNTIYYFKVRGGNGCATGPWSNEISVKTKGLVSFNQLDITQSELEPKLETQESNSSTCQTYIVKSGDSLWSIAKSLLGDGNKYKEIIEQNKDTYSSLETSNNVRAGWELKVNCNKQTAAETQLQGGYDVKVQVVDTEKKPVENATVTLHSNPQTEKTDKNGIALFHNVEQGEHKVLIAYNNFEGEQSVNLTGDVKEFDLNITVQQKTATISTLAYRIIGLMVLIIGFLMFLLVKTKIRKV